ncbi:hypothetical protein SRHO_G00030890 [Serrasalmus rhombeus]
MSLLPSSSHPSAAAAVGNKKDDLCVVRKAGEKRERRRSHSLDEFIDFSANGKEADKCDVRKEDRREKRNSLSLDRLHSCMNYLPERGMTMSSPVDLKLSI